MNFAQPSQPFITFGSLTASFPALTRIHGFRDLTGTVRNFAIGQDFSFIPLDPDPAIGHLRAGMSATVSIDTKRSRSLAGLIGLSSAAQASK